MGHNKVGSYPNQQDQGLRRQGTRTDDQGDKKGKNSWCRGMPGEFLSQAPAETLAPWLRF